MLTRDPQPGTLALALASRRRSPRPAPNSGKGSRARSPRRHREQQQPAASAAPIKLLRDVTCKLALRGSSMALPLGWSAPPDPRSSRARAARRSSARGRMETDVQRVWEVPRAGPTRVSDDSRSFRGESSVDGEVHQRDPSTASELEQTIARGRRSRRRDRGLCWSSGTSSAIRFPSALVAWKHARDRRDVQSPPWPE